TGRRGENRGTNGAVSFVSLALAVTACGCGSSGNTRVDAGIDHGVDLGVSPDQGRPSDQGADLGATDQGATDQDVADQGLLGFRVTHQNTAGATVSRSESFRMVRMNGRGSQGSSPSYSRGTHVTGGSRP
ncbi:MAG: hypothetical protein KBB95_23685, partial [Deltaproteobacteria bacterium]|nr:hypothetical protein [Deltaproteobacteria bacterium]